MFDYAVFANRAYNDSNNAASSSAPYDVRNQRLDMPLGWQEDAAFRIDEVNRTELSEAHGFNAAAFFVGADNEIDETTTEVVIAFRGTDFQSEDSGDILSDLAFGANILPAQIEDAIDYVRRTIDKLTNFSFDPIERQEALQKITFTGHSLGGGLATIMAAIFDRPATVFDPAPTLLTAHVIPLPPTLPGNLVTAIWAALHLINEDQFDKIEDGGYDFELQTINLPDVAPLSRDILLERAKANVEIHRIQGELVSAIFPDYLMPGFGTSTNEIDLGFDEGTASFLERTVGLHNDAILVLALKDSIRSQQKFVELAQALPSMESGETYAGLAQIMLDPKVTALPVYVEGLLLPDQPDVLFHMLTNNDAFYETFYGDVSKILQSRRLGIDPGGTEALLRIAVRETAAHANIQNMTSPSGSEKLLTSAFGVGPELIEIHWASLYQDELETRGPSAFGASVSGRAWATLVADAGNLIGNLGLGSMVGESYFTLVRSLYVATGDQPITISAHAVESERDLDGDYTHDIIIANDGALTAFGGDGRDIILGSSIADRLVGDSGKDLLVGDRGNDELEGGDGDDTLIGMDDADILSGGRGDDELDGGAGFDQYLVTVETDGEVHFDIIRDADGEGTISFIDADTGEVKAVTGFAEYDAIHDVWILGSGLTAQIEDQDLYIFYDAYNAAVIQDFGGGNPFQDSWMGFQLEYRTGSHEVERSGEDGADGRNASLGDGEDGVDAKEVKFELQSADLPMEFKDHELDFSGGNGGRGGFGGEDLNSDVKAGSGGAGGNGADTNVSMDGVSASGDWLRIGAGAGHGRDGMGGSRGGYSGSASGDGGNGGDGGNLTVTIRNNEIKSGDVNIFAFGGLGGNGAWGGKSVAVAPGDPGADGDGGNGGDVLLEIADNTFHSVRLWVTAGGGLGGLNPLEDAPGTDGSGDVLITGNKFYSDGSISGVMLDAIGFLFTDAEDLYLWGRGNDSKVVLEGNSFYGMDGPGSALSLSFFGTSDVIISADLSLSELIVDGKANFISGFEDLTLDCASSSIVGDVADNRFVTGDSHDTLFGEDGDDGLTGGDGDDHLAGGSGNDYLFGDGDGYADEDIDTAYYSGNLSDYDFGRPNDPYLRDMQLKIADKRDGSPDGTDRVEDVEYFQFADQLVSLEELDALAVNHNPVRTGLMPALVPGREDTEYVISQYDLLEGFSDFDPYDTLHVANVAASRGVVTNVDGSFILTPDADFNGEITLRYHISDGYGGYVEASAIVEIEAENDDPQQVGDQVVLPNGEIDTDTIIAVADLLKGFADPDGDELAVASYEGVYYAAYAAVTDNHDGTLTVRSQEGYSGRVTLYYRVVDPYGGETDAELSFIVGPGPVSGSGGVDSLHGGLGMDTILAGGGNDVVDGGGGNDSLYGGDDHDTVRGEDDDDSLSGGAGSDSLDGGFGNDTLNGGARWDTLVGGAGDDSLDGGLGDDRMYGNAGDDTYIVDDIGDRVYEGVGEGTDTVKTSIDYALTSNVENLYLIQGAGLSAVGNGLSNAMHGNTSNNTLSGGLGNDSLYGWDGDDSLAGSNDHDRLSGGEGNDTLVGGRGNDQTGGGAGADDFVFEPISSNGHDHVVDFESSQDRLVFLGADYGFAAGHVLTATEFTVGSAAVDATAQFVWDEVAGKLWWDGDGSGAGEAFEIALISGGATVSRDDLIFI